MAPNHPYHDLPVPQDAPFKLAPSPGKGWGAFATRQIEKGEVILQEEPLFTIPKPQYTATEEDVLLAYRQLNVSEQTQFNYLCNTCSATSTDSTEFDYGIQIVAYNSFAIPQTPPVHGVFLVQSRFNHSCLPNSVVEIYDEGSGERIATRDITAGEEITFDYMTGGYYWTRNERHQNLDFICDCKACLVGTPFQQLSDLRRRLVRGLRYLTFGCEPATQGPTSPVILDSRLRTVAERFSFPLSTRIMYRLLLILLMNEEGVLGSGQGQLHRGMISFELMTAFRTESNVRIARDVIAQETWLGKFQVACGLDGRQDANDFAYNNTLRRASALVRRT